ncbi:SusC/RagA family TonB-linked outer membrane protein [Chryseolinea lacunae]|uniref:SusC/RagA family TonB-linked outer membrane protein n=1 Tax=Chryseolinea lacunae TaxID=2801331 RepID=A0ABS1L1N6_9BACT|nr:SusC/RagA family TonB-linked outer membrane protein [Chryseolinea lacunae]MBL0744847.1 SusC/RagA family TonB-linked outer membrane protein [Chryseolinea lacunae]
MKNLLLVFLLFCGSIDALCQMRVEGRVRSAGDRQPLPGVNVIIKGTTQGTATDSDGKYTLNVREKDVLIFSFIGYAAQEVVVGTEAELNINLVEDIATLEEVMIVSTGYEQVPKERATGSFAQIENTLVNRRVSTDVLSRLEDVTSGLIFNRNVEGATDISIRGRSTIFGNASPLIVIDNFPYDGDIANINPNDVESITVLKDAAAASIWGARAGNGVIVITTKKGVRDLAPHVYFNSNVTVAERPDMFYVPRMSTSDFLDVEKSLFAKGFYESAESSDSHAPLTPAVELMIAHRDGLLDNQTLDQRLDALRGLDVRNDYEKYLYRNSTNQQYALGIQGGSAHNRYNVSVGFDKNLEGLVGNSFNRFTLNASNAWSLMKDKLEVSLGAYYAEVRKEKKNEGLTNLRFDSASPLYPYAQLKDGAGNNLSVVKDYRLGFVEQAQSDGLLNWKYTPLDEINYADNTSRVNDLRLNARLAYKITSSLRAEALYQYWNSSNAMRNNQSIDSYVTRDQINKFTQVDSDGNLVRPIPASGILDANDVQSSSYNFRAQLNFGKTWDDHDVHALGGYEVKELNTDGNTFRYYGYNNGLATTQRVDYTTFFPLYNNVYQYYSIPNNDGVQSLTDRFVSYYGNAAYTYKRRYTLSASGRKDMSNLFGVKANQRGVPLWSVGLAWTATNEGFMDTAWLPYLKLRTTYGYNGNIDKSVTAYTTAVSLGYNSLTGLPYSTILNPPNPELQWEQVRIWNTGIDFETKNQALSGSIEYYTKWGKNLIGSSPFPPSSGVAVFRGNNANTRGSGVDLVLNTQNINRGIKWTTNFLFSHLTEKVTSYKIKAAPTNYVYSGSGSALVSYPLEDKPLFAIYSFDWAGLDPEGNPKGYVEGVESTDYAAIIGKSTPESIVYHGSARPTSFGSVRNTFSWRNFSLSVNISYRLGYYFKRSSVRYANVLSGSVDHADYGARWQHPGDELFTSVPSMPEFIDINRDNFYLNSSALVEKGDHVRLQDVNLTYTLNRATLARLPFSNVQFYLYANNLGILWKATDVALDPDYPTMKPVRSFAAGVRIEF